MQKINLFAILIVSFLALLLWSIFFEIDKSINVTGVIEPKGNVISLQNRFDSKIIDIRTVAGEYVTKNQTLFILDPDLDSGELKEKELEVRGLETQHRRLLAQLEKTHEFKFLGNDDEKVYLQELEQLKLELGAYFNEIETLKGEKNLVLKEIESAKISRINLENLTKLLEKKYEITKKLYDKNFEGELALLEAQQKFAESRGNVAVASENLLRLSEQVTTVEKKIQQLKLNFNRDTSKNIAEVSRKIEFGILNIATLREKIEEFEVKSPLDGTISKVFFNNIGEIVPKASTLGELIPKSRPLIFSTKLKPGDILEVFENQKASITLSNMDTRKDPPLPGKVSFVEQNSRIEENLGRYFVAEISFLPSSQSDKIVPGVDGSASITLGKRSVLEYFMEPIFASFKGAMSE